MFGSRVRYSSNGARKARVASDVDNTPAPGFQHVWDNFPHEVDRSGEVDRDVSLPHFIGQGVCAGIRVHNPSHV